MNCYIWTWRIISWSQSVFAWHSGAIRMKCGCEMKPVDTGFSYPSPLLRSTYLWKPVFFSMKSFQFTCWTNINDIPQPRECSSSGWMCFWTTWSSKNVHAHGRGSCWFLNFWFLKILSYLKRSFPTRTILRCSMKGQVISNIPKAKTESK